VGVRRSYVRLRTSPEGNIYRATVPSDGLAYGRLLL
jgi:hypothetical protein